MTELAWLRAYADLQRRLPAYVQHARPLLCGFSACVDARVALHDAGPLLSADPSSPAGSLAAELVRRMAAGVGGEVRSEWADGPAWLARHLPHATAAGGTGAQAAETLAVLGAPALLALADRSPQQLAVTHPQVLLAVDRRSVPAGQITPAGTGKPAHWIFEYTAGTAVAGVVPARSSRVIVRFADDGLEDDPAFAAVSVEMAATAGAGIVSGFNGVPSVRRPAALARVATLARRWRQEGTALVHLELGDYGSQDVVRQVLDGLCPVVTSLGMSASELARFVPGDQPVAEKARSLGQRLGLGRVAIHADAWALAVTRGDPAAERDALLAGCLLAAARAGAGRPIRPTGVPAGAVFLDPPPGADLGDGWRAVVCAAPYLARPACTVGLGDTFLAGCLLVLGRPASKPAFVPTDLEGLHP